MSTFGELIKKHRLELELSLREFCLENGFDHGNMSKLERGLFSPPRDHEKLEQYAIALKIEKGSGEWLEFFDRAAAEKGEIPKDLMDAEIIDKLPVLFRTIRAERVTPEKLDDLVERIKES